MDTQCEVSSTPQRSQDSTYKVKCRESITTAYVVLTPGKSIDVSLLKALEFLRFAVKYCGKNDVGNLCCDGNSVVIEDFSNFIKQRHPSILYYGPVAIKRTVASKRRLPFTGHSILTTILYGKSCCLNVSREHQAKYRLHIYALGGRLAESIADATFLVTSTAAGKMYDIARKLQIKVVTPKLIDFLWSWRNSLEFVFDEKHLRWFKLPVFANLKIFFYGFDDAERYQLEETAITNGAIVLNSPTATSLVIVNPNAETTASEVLPARSLGTRWFHESLSEGHAKSITNTDVQYNVIDSSTDERLFILDELRSSEVKYVETIGMIVEMVVRHLGHLDLGWIGPQDHGDAIITKFQRIKMFGDFPNLFYLHRELLRRIEAIVETRNVEGISEAFSAGINVVGASTDSFPEHHDRSIANQIVAVYKSYLSSVESTRNQVLALEAVNPAFAQFVRLTEDRAESGREKLVDLLVHPMQRWPRILLFMKRLAEVNERIRTPHEVESCDSIRHALDKVQGIVQKLNESKAHKSVMSKTLDILSQIEEMPSIFWSQHYTLRLYLEVVVRSFLNKSGKTNFVANCFVFTHGLEIAKSKKSLPDKPEVQTLKHTEYIRFINVQMFLLESMLDRNHIEICYRHDDLSREQILLECGTSQIRDNFVSHLRLLCAKPVEIHEISDREQKMRCESLLLQWYQSRKESTATKSLFRNILENVNKLF